MENKKIDMKWCLSLIHIYLVPQEYGCHADTHWVKLYGPADGAGTAFAGESGAAGQRSRCLEISMEEKPFYFSAIPYTPQELESALDRKSTRLNSSHRSLSRMPSSA